MNAERYVVLGLARPRSAWFSDISRWATAAAIPVEFVKCLGPDEARARLASGRRWSAFLVDADAPGIDRDLLDAAVAVGAAPLVIARGHISRDWAALGAAAVLPDSPTRDDVVAALAEHARPVVRAAPAPDDDHSPSPPPWRGRIVAVTGSGGTGASTIAALMAHGFGTDVREQGLVVLADLALHADQAVLHDAGEIVPGLPELVDAHRLGRPEDDELRALTFHGGSSRPYDLLLGLRRHRDWAALRPRAVEAALDGLRRAYRTVVADVEPDVEGERETGSLDIEERNLLARATIASADAVVVVGRPDVVGVHRLAALVRDLCAFGAHPDHVLPVINRAPRSPRARAEITSALASLAGQIAGDLPSPVFVQERRRLEETVRTGGSWPSGPSRELAAAAAAVIDRASGPRTARGPEPVAPGSLGRFSDAEFDAS